MGLVIFQKALAPKALFFTYLAPYYSFAVSETYSNVCNSIYV